MPMARFLLDPPLPGPANMGRDAALLERCGDGSPIVLRFYAWSPATISLGYFQDHADYLDLPPPAGRLPVVRRTTGGGAILHDLELTYSLVIPLSHPLVKGRPNSLYNVAHEAVIAAVGHDVHFVGDGCTSCGGAAQRGPFFCFARRHALDVAIGDSRGPGGLSKIAGSAQRRTPNAILQHGSIMLDSRYPQQPVITWSALAGEEIGFQAAVERLLPAFAEGLGVSFQPGEWSDDELSLAQTIEARYASEAWTIYRQRSSSLK